MLDIHDLKQTKIFLPEECKCQMRRLCTSVTEPAAPHYWVNCNTRCLCVDVWHVFITANTSNSDEELHRYHLTTEAEQQQAQRSVKLAKKMSANTLKQPDWQQFDENIASKRPKMQILLYFHQVVCFKLPWHGPFVLHHFVKAYALVHLLLLFTLYILIVNVMQVLV